MQICELASWSDVLLKKLLSNYVDPVAIKLKQFLINV